MTLLDWFLNRDADDTTTPEDGCTGPDLQCGCGLCWERWRVAIHEAGHVVALDAYGLEWNYAVIEDDPTGLSYSSGGRVDVSGDTDDLDLGDVYRFMVVYHAGHAAERAMFGRHAGSEADEEMLALLVDRWGHQGGYDQARADAETLIGDRPGELRDAAEALFTEGRIEP